MNQKEVACIIDDDRIFVFGLSKLIEMTSFCKNLLSFQNGKEAIEHIRTESANPNRLPDIILLDINMPIMDGWQFMDEFVQIKNTLPKKISICMVSSSVSEADISKAKEYEDIVEYIVKPIKSEDLQRIKVKY